MFYSRILGKMRDLVCETRHCTYRQEGAISLLRTNRLRANCAYLCFRRLYWIIERLTGAQWARTLTTAERIDVFDVGNEERDAVRQQGVTSKQRDGKEGAHSAQYFMDHTAPLYSNVRKGSFVRLFAVRLCARRNSVVEPSPLTRLARERVCSLLESGRFRLAALRKQI